MYFLSLFCAWAQILSRDESISRTVRIAVDMSGANNLRIGRPGASVVQDLEVLNTFLHDSFSMHDSFFMSLFSVYH